MSLHFVSGSIPQITDAGSTENSAYVSIFLFLDWLKVCSGFPDLVGRNPDTMMMMMMMMNTARGPGTSQPPVNHAAAQYPRETSIVLCATLAATKSPNWHRVSLPLCLETVPTLLSVVTILKHQKYGFLCVPSQLRITFLAHISTSGSPFIPNICA